MARIVMIMISVDDDVTNDIVHEGLCQILHEGKSIDDNSQPLIAGSVNDIQVIGALEGYKHESE